MTSVRNLSRRVQQTRSRFNISRQRRLLEADAASALRGLRELAEGKVLTDEELDRALTPMTAEQWLSQNAEAIASSNEFVNERGVPLSKHRMF